MNKTTFQHPELRDANDNIIQQGAYGKNSAFVNGQNNGILDYINNNLEFLYDSIGDINNLTSVVNSINDNINNIDASIQNLQSEKANDNDVLKKQGGVVSGNITTDFDQSLELENNTLVTAKFVKGLKYISCFVSVEQLGLSKPCTVVDIIKVMPSNTQAMITVGAKSTDITDIVTSYGLLVIRKGENIQRTDIEFKQSSSSGGTAKYFASYNSNNDLLSWYRYTATAL